MMFTRDLKLGFFIYITLGLFLSPPAFGGSVVIGLVAGGTNATLGGRPLVRNTAIFSGDRLEIRDGAAIVAVGGTSRMAFGGNTLASFLSESNEVTVLLGRGNVSLYHPDDSVNLKVNVGDISVSPASGWKTLGEIATVGGSVVITAREGLLRVEGNGPAVEVARGKTITVGAKTAQRPPSTGQAGSAARISGHMAVQIASATAAATAVVLGAVAMSRASDAKDQASKANSAGAAAATAANAATSAANFASSAANAATASAQSTLVTTVIVGCAENKALPNASVSPFKPPTGFTCP